MEWECSIPGPTRGDDDKLRHFPPPRSQPCSAISPPAMRRQGRKAESQPLIAAVRRNPPVLMEREYGWAMVGVDGTIFQVILREQSFGPECIHLRLVAASSRPVDGQQKQSS